MLRPKSWSLCSNLSFFGGLIWPSKTPHSHKGEGTKCGSWFTLAIQGIVVFWWTGKIPSNKSWELQYDVWMKESPLLASWRVARRSKPPQTTLSSKVRVFRNYLSRYTVGGKRASNTSIQMIQLATSIQMIQLVTSIQMICYQVDHSMLAHL
jgi:hypothetical protein